MNLHLAASRLRETLERRTRLKEFDLELFRQITISPEFLGLRTREERARYFNALTRESLDYPFVASLVAHTIALEVIRRFSPNGEQLADNLIGKTLAFGNHEQSQFSDPRQIISSFNPVSCEGRIEKPIVTNGAHAEFALLSYWREGYGERRLQIAAWDMTGLRREDLAPVLKGFFTGSIGSLAVAAPAPTLMLPRFEFPTESTSSIFETCLEDERIYLRAAMEGLIDGLRGSSCAQTRNARVVSRRMNTRDEQNALPSRKLFRTCVMS